MNKQFNDFIRVCNIVREKESKTFGANEIENELLDVLNFIKSNKEIEGEMKLFFVKIIEERKDYPIALITFCIRELQWPEIKEATISERNKTDDWRIISLFNDILKVYEDEWDDAEFYEYYSPK
jgi:hypothetical protein